MFEYIYIIYGSMDCTVISDLMIINLHYEHIDNNIIELRSQLRTLLGWKQNESIGKKERISDNFSNVCYPIYWECDTQSYSRCIDRAPLRLWVNSSRNLHSLESIGCQRQAILLCKSIHLLEIFLYCNEPIQCPLKLHEAQYKK